MHLAAVAGRADVVQALADAGANVNTADHDGDTPLHIAAMSSNMDVLGMLLSANANVNLANSRGSTPMHFAAAAGHADVVQTLAHAGANVNAADQDGNTPLHIAATRSRLSMSRFGALQSHDGESEVGSAGEGSDAWVTLGMDDIPRRPKSVGVYGQERFDDRDSVVWQ